MPDIENGSIAQEAVTRLKGAAGNKSVDTRCFISSPGCELDRTAPWRLHTIRRHWCIKNKLHRVFDVTYEQGHVYCRNDNCLRDVTTLNKVMYNFTSAARGLPGKECGEKVSMPGPKDQLCLPCLDFETDCEVLCRHVRAMEGQRTPGLPHDRLCKTCCNPSSPAMKKI